MYSIYDGKRKVDNTMSDQIEREQQIEEESLTKNSLQIQKAAWIREELGNAGRRKIKLFSKQILPGAGNSCRNSMKTWIRIWRMQKRGGDIPGIFFSACPKNQTFSDLLQFSQEQVRTSDLQPEQEYFHNNVAQFSLYKYTYLQFHVLVSK